MAGMYTGIENIARKVKGGYAGVENIARKLVKGYIGVADVARPFWSGETEKILSYYGVITPLSTAAERLSAVSIGIYALFGGGYPRSDVVDAYSDILVRSNPTSLQSVRGYTAGSSNGNHAMICGGSTPDWVNSTHVDAYDASLVRYLTGLSLAVSFAGGASIGQYNLIAGGSAAAGNTDVVNAFDENLVRTNPTSLSGAAQTQGASNNNYAFFHGGSFVNAYDKNLVRTIAAAPPETVYNSAGAGNGEHVLFGGGQLGQDCKDIVIAYDLALVQTTLQSLSAARNNMGGASIDGYILFGGGLSSGSTSKNEVDVYDKTLTHSVMTPLSAARYSAGAARVGSYVLFAGGGASTGRSDKVDVYQSL